MSVQYIKKYVVAETEKLQRQKIENCNKIYCCNDFHNGGSQESLKRPPRDFYVNYDTFMKQKGEDEVEGLN